MQTGTMSCRDLTFSVRIRSTCHQRRDQSLAGLQTHVHWRVHGKRDHLLHMLHLMSVDVGTPEQVWHRLQKDRREDQNTRV